MTKSKKTIIISIISVLLAGIIVGMVFLGIFLYKRYTPEVRYANAQQRWEEAEEKKAYDDIAIDFHFGYEGNTLDLLLTMEGYRIYKGNNITAQYYIDLIGMYEGLSPTIMSLEADIGVGEDTSSIKIEQKSGMIDFDGIEINTTNEEEKDLNLNFNKLIFYNTQRLFIAKNGNYYIEGRNAVDDIINALTMVMTDYVEIDLWGFLEKKTNFSRVKGDVYYKGAFIADKVKSSQNISFYIPWQELDEIVEEMSENIPQNIMEIYQNKKIEIEVPLFGAVTIDLFDYMPENEGILANVRIITESRYEILD